MIFTDPSAMQINSEIIVTLAKQALNNKPFFNRYSTAYSSLDYRNEFCTVRIGLPRRSGQTTAALQLMYEYPDSVLFTPRKCNEYVLSYLADYIDDRTTISRIIKHTFVLGSNISSKIDQYSHPTFLIFDGTGLVDENLIEKIKTQFDPQIVVELQ